MSRTQIWMHSKCVKHGCKYALKSGKICNVSIETCWFWWYEHVLCGYQHFSDMKWVIVNG